MVHEGDTLRDLQLNTDRQVHLDDTGDLDQTSGVETVKQSAMLNAGQFLRPLVGEPITAQRIGHAESKIKQTLQNDPQIASVRSVRISAIDKDTNSVTIDVHTDVEHEFVIEDIL